MLNRQTPLERSQAAPSTVSVGSFFFDVGPLIDACMRNHPMHQAELTAASQVSPENAAYTDELKLEMARQWDETGRAAAERDSEVVKSVFDAGWPEYAAFSAAANFVSTLHRKLESALQQRLGYRRAEMSSESFRLECSLASRCRRAADELLRLSASFEVRGGAHALDLYFGVDGWRGYLDEIHSRSSSPPGALSTSEAVELLREVRRARLCVPDAPELDHRLSAIEVALGLRIDKAKAPVALARMVIDSGRKLARILACFDEPPTAGESLDEWTRYLRLGLAHSPIHTSIVSEELNSPKGRQQLMLYVLSVELIRKVRTEFPLLPDACNKDMTLRDDYVAAVQGAIDAYRASLNVNRLGKRSPGAGLYRAFAELCQLLNLDCINPKDTFKKAVKSSENKM